MKTSARRLALRGGVEPAPSSLSATALRPLFTLRAHTAEVQTIDFFRDGPQAQQFIVSGDVAGGVKVWNLASRRVVAQWEPHAPRGVLQTDYHQNVLMTQGREGCVALWDLNHGGGGGSRRHTASSSSSTPSLNAVAQIARFDNHSHGFCRAEFLRLDSPTPSSSTTQATSVDGSAGAAERDNDAGGDNRDGADGAAATDDLKSSAEADDDDNCDSCPGGPIDDTGRGGGGGDAGGAGGYDGSHLVIGPALDGEEVVVWDVRARDLAFRIAPASMTPSPSSSSRSPGGKGGGMCMALASTVHAGRPYVYVAMEAGTVGLFDLAERKCCGQAATSGRADDVGDEGDDGAAAAGAGGASSATVKAPSALAVMPCPILDIVTAPSSR